MNKLILCEGETDAILLSYYLGQIAGRKYCNKVPKNLDIKKHSDNESVNWYKKGDDYLLICGVGGKDNFGKFFETRIKAPLVTVNAFEKIAIIIDRDNRNVNEIRNSLLLSMGDFFDDIRDREWCSNSYQDGYGIAQSLELLLVVIPKEHLGALETVLLDAISEKPYDKNIVEKATVFVRKMRLEASKYIGSDRLQLKAQLGVTWAVQFPEKVFSRIDEQIKNVQWEKYEVLRECFSSLEKI